MKLAGKPLPVQLNCGALERVLLDFVRNASDAMADNGQTS